MMRKTLEEKQSEMRERHVPKGKPFEPGCSGNPTGRNAGRPRALLPLASAPEVRRQLAEIDSSGQSNFSRIVAAQIEIAKKGTKAPNAASRAFDALMDRAFGRPTQTVDQKITLSRDEDEKFLLHFLGHGQQDGTTQ